jgi:hypothetical protein
MKLSLVKLLPAEAIYRLLKPWLLKYADDPKISDEQLRRPSTAAWDCLGQWINCLETDPIETRSTRCQIIIPIVKELNMSVIVTWPK